LGGVGDASRCSNVIANDDVESRELSSIWWFDACQRQICGWSPMNIFFFTLFSFHTLVFRVGRAKNQILLLLLTSILVFILVIAICFVFNAF
jgi:hypothetical protein